MVKTKIIQNITKEGKYILKEFTGKVLSVHFKFENPLPQIHVKLVTNHFEEVLNFTGLEQVKSFYPFNVVGGVGHEPKFQDHYYVDGYLILEIRNLPKDENINSVHILYE